jgi:RNA polymerase sigma-70 factor (ECF subfamily)
MEILLERPMPTEAGGPTEADLVAGCRAGRRDALDELARRHYGRIHRLAWAMAGPEGAADLAQETFLAAIRALPSFRGDCALSTWLISILRNQYTLWLRGRRKWKTTALGGELPAPEPRQVEGAAREVLERARELPEELRTTLVLFYVEGLKYAEIAQAMDCPIGTVRSRLFEARERLKARLGGEKAP